MVNIYNSLIFSNSIQEAVFEKNKSSLESQPDQIKSDMLSYYVDIDLKKIIKSAPQMYKVYTIPKRSHGYRVIAHPAKLLKVYQSSLSHILSGILPVHKSAFAYKKKISITDNARVHQNSKYLLKMDCVNFFNSITPLLLFNELKLNDFELSEQDKNILKQLLFWSPSKTNGSNWSADLVYNRKLVLSVGAPSSPLVSNFIMYRFDTLIHDICTLNKVKYSRYADDLFFSTNEKNILFKFPAMINSLLVDIFGSDITINETKTKFSSKAHNRFITGITLANDDSISLGRKRKRYISSLVHKFALGLLMDEEIRHLQGLLSFASHVEPNFICRLEKKYSVSVLSKIKTSR